MKIRAVAMTGLCLLALCVPASAARKAPKPTKCASPAEVTAMQTTAVQQQLMDASLTCGPLALTNYNAFQTRFGPELRTSDDVMKKMFARLISGKKGMLAYHTFKTDLANKAELRRGDNPVDFCKEANLVAAAALGPAKIRLADFVADIPAVETASGVNKCSIAVGATFQGALAVPGVVPKPNPLRMATP